MADEKPNYAMLTESLSIALDFSKQCGESALTKKLETALAAVKPKLDAQSELEAEAEPEPEVE